MKIELELSDIIYENIKDRAVSMGVTVNEIIRITLGSNFQTFKPTMMMASPSSVSSKDTDRLMKLYQLSMTQQVKCPSCGQQLTTKDIDANECHLCSYKLLE